ncbi:MAG TPA: 5-oxoprolinase subunit PxpB [Xanthomonadaceae bacterium]|jgi:KipI family sensor histidine kinase inhibitor
MNADPRIERLGDAALLLRFGDSVDAALNRRVHACAEALRAQAPGWLSELTPAYASLALHVDAARIGSDDPLEPAQRWLQDWLASARIDTQSAASRLVDIPVLYGGAAGPDLANVAARAGIDVEEAAARHAAADYTVAMLGFAPGFPYLLGLDARLATPRHATPRRRVEAGSVGIGGAQTGIYPDAGPGGWQLIGRTPLRLFDVRREQPSLLRAGDRVRFIAIDATTFADTSGHDR